MDIIQKKQQLGNRNSRHCNIFFSAQRFQVVVQFWLPGMITAGISKHSCQCHVGWFLPQASAQAYFGSNISPPNQHPHIAITASHSLRCDAPKKNIFGILANMLVPSGQINYLYHGSWTV